MMLSSRSLKTARELVLMRELSKDPRNCLPPIAWWLRLLSFLHTGTSGRSSFWKLGDVNLLDEEAVGRREDFSDFSILLLLKF